ncbi:MAG: signal peptidase I [Deltaproteobacteria bacterium]|nr:signal peptidase I [Deltaproteobacteria bacterium]
MVMQKIDQPKKSGHKREAFEAIFVALLIAVLLRAFIVEAFVIPSPSMVPTLLEGDFILVNKFAYGLRIPFTKKRVLYQGRTPKPGEIIIFMFPWEQAPIFQRDYKGKDFIKRVVGVPGDRIRVGDYKKTLPDGSEVLVEGQLFVNDQPVQKVKISDLEDLEDFSGPASLFEEEIQGIKHMIREKKNKAFSGGKYYPRPGEESYFTVPQNSLFVMGDNRDNSSDSRSWGVVPMENLKGTALFIWMSVELGESSNFFMRLIKSKGVRWNRISKIIL